MMPFRSTKSEEPVQVLEFGPPSMLMSTTPDIPGFKISQLLGVCIGVAICNLNWVDAIEEKISSHRRRAMDQLIEHARTLGGNAIVGMRFGSNDIPGSAQRIEILAYGTAVVIETCPE